MSAENEAELQAGPENGVGMSQPFAHEPQSLMDVWRVLVKRRVIILVITILVFAGSAIYSYHLKPIYESWSRIEIDPTKSPNVGLQNLVDDASGPNSSGLQTQLLILQSDTVLLQTAKNLNLISAMRGGAGRAGAPSGENSNQDLTPNEQRSLINVIKGGLRVSVIGGTQIVDIRYRSTDPKLAPVIVNELVDTYIDQDLHSKFDRTMHVSTWLEKQLEDLKQQASDAQRALVEYQKAHNIVSSDTASNLTMTNLAQMSSEYEGAELNRITKEARMRDFASQDADIAALMGDNPRVGELRIQKDELEKQRAQQSITLGPRHPRIVELDVQIQKVQASIDYEVALAKRQIMNEYTGASHLEQTLRGRLDAQKDAAYRLNEDEAQYEILQHEAALNRNLYDALQVRLKEASVTAGLSATNISVVDRAQISTSAVAPNKRMNVLMGLLGGLVLGIVAAFVIESVDDTLQTSEEAEKVSMLPALATIPHIQPTAPKEGLADEFVRRQIPVLTDTKSNVAEAYRSLRSALLLTSFDKPPQVILLTSAFPAEGKTTTAINMAVALAQRGERVLLVDADLRRGRIAKEIFAPINPDMGLSYVLSHPTHSSEFSVPFPELPTLQMLPTGPRPPNPAEMLSSHRMEEQLDQWRHEFDRIVFDTAPVLSVSDTQAMARWADAVVLVVRAGFTRKRALVRARDLLFRINAPILGVVINDADMRLENFYTYRYGMYGYNYGYRYRYGYSDYKAYGYEDEEKGE